MTNDLTSWVIDQIVGAKIEDETGYLILAALDGDAELDAYLSSGERSRELEVDGPAHQARDVGGTFLASVEVEGFRGIGPKVCLDLNARPGLTVIAGRNGSGKSSIAEAIELLLTGSTYRWKNKLAPWKQHWRNLHYTGVSRIRLTVTEESVDKLTTVHTEWAEHADGVDDRTTWTQVRGKPKQDLESLGWAGPLETFRPLLSYDELGGILVTGQAMLYDALATVLGVEQLTDAVKRIGERLKTLKGPHAHAAAERRDLQRAAAGLDDERATKVAALLRKTAPDVDAIRAVVTGLDSTDQGPVGKLRALARLGGPDEGSVTASAAQLRAAVGKMAAAGERRSQLELDQIELRRHALALHQTHGDMPCPVCSGNVLDGEWAEATGRQNAIAEAETADLTQAHQELGRARSDARGYLRACPPELQDSPLPELDDAIDLARATWDAWCDAPAQDLELADHLDLHVVELGDALRALRTAAAAEAAARDDAWSQLAVGIAAWCDTYNETLRTKPQVELLGNAESWLKTLDTKAKNERLAPIVDEARHAWTMLRQESNVDLVGMELTGSNTSRRVAISATVDGQEASALPVMSQGELHALALALFLPRASMAESPFRFLVIDDPVQAMDPAKVDGLVELLTTLSKTRQVIVLSHDDRLPAAIRRSRAEADLLEVKRGLGSAVQIVHSADPASRYLADAMGLVRDTNLPDDTARRVLPGLLRMAVESAAKDRFFAQQLKAGARLTDLETTWERTRKTSQRVSLAINGEARPLDSWLSRGYRKSGLGVVTSGFHAGVRDRANLQAIVHSVEQMVDDIRLGST